MERGNQKTQKREQSEPSKGDLMKTLDVEILELFEKRGINVVLVVKSESGKMKWIVEESDA